MLLTYREEIKQPRRLIAGLPAPSFLSCTGKLIWYLHRSYFLPYRNTVSTPDASGVTKFYRTYYNQWCCLDARRQIPNSKLLPHSIYDILTHIYNYLYCPVQCRHVVSLLLFCRCFPLLFFICHSAISIFLSSLGSANVRHVHWWALSPLYHEQTRPLLLTGYKFVLVLGLTQFSKAFLKKYIPHL